MSKKRPYFMKEVSVEKVQRVAQMPGVEVRYDFEVNARSLHTSASSYASARLDIYVIADEFIYYIGSHQYYNKYDTLVSEPIGIRVEKSADRLSRIRNSTKTLAEMLGKRFVCTVTSRAVINVNNPDNPTRISLAMKEPEVYWDE